MPDAPAKNQLRNLICLALAVVTFAVYLPSLRNGFINYDDPDYIINNVHISSGLSWRNIAWAFQHANAGLWIPLTWISHMTDCQLFGLNPAGHHLVNVLFHTANTLLLFLLLNRLTGALWRSAFVAALFAWHPLRVESVAWAAERKDVLAAFFWMLTLLVYTRFVSESNAQSQKSKLFYILALMFFACGLMSKSMVVTLPFVLLLLDFWPLGRFRAQGSEFSSTNVFKLIAEKIPFFALAAATSIITSFTAKETLWSSLPLASRLANTVISYLRYVSKTFWPVDLAVIYPYPHQWPVGLAVAAGLFLAVWTFLVIVCLWRNPYLFTGWFWFLGTLVPVIGLLQAGVQSMADRFTYIPSIGLWILIVWSVGDLVPLTLRRKQIVALLGGTALGVCLILTSVQLKYWKNSVTLFTHTLQITSDNYLAADCLGQTMERLGRTDDALALYTESVKAEPYFPLGQFKLGMMLLSKGRTEEASNHLAAAAQLAPHDPVMQFDFGVFLAQHGQPDIAAEHFQTALADKPDFPEARQQLDLLKTNPPANRSTP